MEDSSVDTVEVLHQYVFKVTLVIDDRTDIKILDFEKESS